MSPYVDTMEYPGTPENADILLKQSCPVLPDRDAELFDACREWLVQWLAEDRETLTEVKRLGEHTDDLLAFCEGYKAHRSKVVTVLKRPVGMYTREPLAIPGNEKLAVEEHLRRDEAPAMYDALVEFMRECFKDWDAGVPTLTIQDYESEVIGFFAGYRAAQGK